MCVVWTVKRKHRDVGVMLVWPKFHICTQQYLIEFLNSTPRLSSQWQTVCLELNNKTGVRPQIQNKYVHQQHGCFTKSQQISIVTFSTAKRAWPMGNPSASSCIKCNDLRAVECYCHSVPNETKTSENKNAYINICKKKNIKLLSLSSK